MSFNKIPQNVFSKMLSTMHKTRSFHTSAAVHKVQAGRYRITPRRDFPLTYEMANPPHQIAHRKSWNSWNTCPCDTLQDFLQFLAESERDRLPQLMLIGCIGTSLSLYARNCNKSCKVSNRPYVQFQCNFKPKPKH